MGWVTDREIVLGIAGILAFIINEAKIVTEYRATLNDNTMSKNFYVLC